MTANKVKLNEPTGSAITRSAAVFEREIAGGDPVQDDYDRLLEGLRTGRFGGLPTETSGAFALVETLRRRHWPVDFRSFAAAIPHFAPNLGLNEMRAALRVIGFNSRQDRIKGRNLSILPDGSFVVLPNGAMAFLRVTEDGREILVDQSSGQVHVLRPRTIYDCILIDDLDDLEHQSRQRSGWIGNTLFRFAPENNIILLITLMSNSLVVLASLSVGFVFDKVLPSEALDTLAALMIGIAILFYVDLRLRNLKSKIIAQVSGRLEYIVSCSLYERLISFPLEMLTTAAVSDQMNRLKQFESVRDFYAGPFVAVVFELPFVALLLGVLFMLDPIIGLVLLGAVVAYFLVGALLYPRISRTSRAMGALRGECMRLQEETIAQRQQIVARGLGATWSARLAPKFTALSMARQKVEAVWRALNSIIAVATPLVVGTVIMIGATRVMSGNMTGGALIACTILSTRLLSPVQQALILAVRVPELMNLFRQIDSMMQIRTEAQSSGVEEATVFKRVATAPPITVDGLVLRYPRSVTPALRGLNVTFEGGSFTCITGPSGAGKSSLLRAAMGHYQAQSGTILIGHSNIDQLGSREKTNLIGYLGHQSLQIHGTLAQNLRLTRPDATSEELREISEELGILRSIEAMADGFSARFDHQARHKFSPAFRTKFALAQLLLKKPKILLLDEPESGLSNEDENLIMSAVKRRTGIMTCLMVTHRPSLAKQADYVLALNAGQAQFFGRPEQLEAKKP